MAFTPLGQDEEPAAPAPGAFRFKPLKPAIDNGDGTFSTERTIGIEADGRHLNIPTIVRGRRVSDDEAIAAWERGENPEVGSFASREEADAAAPARSDAIGRSRPNVSRETYPSGPIVEPERPSITGFIRHLLGDRERRESVMAPVERPAQPSPASSLMGAEMSIGEQPAQPAKPARRLVIGPAKEPLVPFGEASPFDVVRELPGRFRQGAGRLALEGARYANILTGDIPGARAKDAALEELRRDELASRARSMSGGEESTAATAAGALPQSLAYMASFMVGGAPLAFTTSQPQIVDSYKRARQLGNDPLTAFLGAQGKVAAEVVPERFGFQFLTNLFRLPANATAAQVLKAVGAQHAAEQGEEQVTNLANFVIDRMMNDPEATPEKLLADAVEAAKVTAFLAPVLGGGALAARQIPGIVRAIEERIAPGRALGRALQEEVDATELRDAAPLVSQIRRTLSERQEAEGASRPGDSRDQQLPALSRAQPLDTEEEAAPTPQTLRAQALRGEEPTLRSITPESLRAQALRGEEPATRSIMPQFLRRQALAQPRRDEPEEEEAPAARRGVGAELSLDYYEPFRAATGKYPWEMPFEQFFKRTVSKLKAAAPGKPASWYEGVIRAEWTKAKQMAPRRGVGAGGFAASPEIVERVRRRVAAAEADQPEFERWVTSLADELGLGALVAPVKGFVRALDKVVGEYRGDDAQLKDLNRATVVVDSPVGVAPVLSKLNETGLPVEKVRNFYEAPGHFGYRDGMVVLRTPNGFREVQVNTPEMIEAKERAHVLYEWQQALARRAADENRTFTPEEAAFVAQTDKRMTTLYDAAMLANRRRVEMGINYVGRELNDAATRAFQRGRELSAEERARWETSLSKVGLSIGVSEAGLGQRAMRRGEAESNASTTPVERSTQTGTPSKSQYSFAIGRSVAQTENLDVQADQAGRADAAAEGDSTQDAGGRRGDPGGALPRQGVGAERVGRPDKNAGKHPASPIASVDEAVAIDRAYPPAKSRLGKCHVLSWRMVNTDHLLPQAQQRGLKQVIGVTAAAPSDKVPLAHQFPLKIWHSVALDPKTGSVWEPIGNRWYKPDVMVKAFGFEPVAAFSAEESLKLAMKSGVYTDQTVVELRGNKATFLERGDYDPDPSIFAQPRQGVGSQGAVAREEGPDYTAQPGEKIIVYRVAKRPTLDNSNGGNALGVAMHVRNNEGSNNIGNTMFAFEVEVPATWERYDPVTGNQKHWYKNPGRTKVGEQIAYSFPEGYPTRLIGQVPMHELRMKLGAMGVAKVSDNPAALAQLIREAFEQKGGVGGRLAVDFYSPLTRAVEQLKPLTMPADQWMNKLKALPGVKKIELELTGILDWLEAKQAKPAVFEEAKHELLLAGEPAAESVHNIAPTIPPSRISRVVGEVMRAAGNTGGEVSAEALMTASATVKRIYDGYADTLGEALRVLEIIEANRPTIRLGEPEEIAPAKPGEKLTRDQILDYLHQNKLHLTYTSAEDYGDETFDRDEYEAKLEEWEGRVSERAWEMASEDMSDGIAREMPEEPEFEIEGTPTLDMFSGKPSYYANLVLGEPGTVEDYPRGREDRARLRNLPAGSRRNYQWNYDESDRWRERLGPFPTEAEARSAAKRLILELRQDEEERRYEYSSDYLDADAYEEAARHELSDDRPEEPSAEHPDPEAYKDYSIKGGKDYTEAFVVSEGLGTWGDGHPGYDWAENPVVRLRFDTRQSEGKTIMFVQEIQPPNARNFKRMPKPLQDNWAQIGFKFAIRHALERGFDGVAITTGRQQELLYPAVSEQVETVVWDNPPFGDVAAEISVKAKGGQAIRLKAKNGEFIGAESDQNEEIVKGKTIEEVFGKKVAEKMRQPGAGSARGSEIDLSLSKVGKLYDEKLPVVLNEVGKKLGVRVSKLEIPDPNLQYPYGMSAPPTGELRQITREMAADNSRQFARSDVGRYTLMLQDGRQYGAFATEEDAQEAVKRFSGKLTMTQPGLLFTPEMRAAVAERGIALPAGKPRANTRFDLFPKPAKGTRSFEEQGLKTGRPADLGFATRAEQENMRELNEGERALVAELIEHLVSKGRMPKAIAQSVTYIVNSPALPGFGGFDATFFPEINALSINIDMIRYATQMPGGKGALAGVIAHELTHRVDFHGAPNHGADEPLDTPTTRSPRMHFRATVDLVTGRVKATGGDLAMEFIDAYNSGPPALRDLFDYPLRNLAVAAFDLNYIKVEFPAQVGALYHARPEIVKAYLPKWYAVMEAIYGSEEKTVSPPQSVDEAHERLRQALQDPGSNESRPRRGVRAGVGSGAREADPSRSPRGPPESRVGVGAASNAAGAGQRPAGAGGRAGGSRAAGPGAAGANPYWSINEPGLIEALRREWQDNKIDLKAVQTAIERAGGIISEPANVYLAEERYHGRVATLLKRFFTREVEPLLKEIRDSKVSIEEVGQFLWARHAKERNAQMARINPGGPTNLSGLYDDARAAAAAGQPGAPNAADILIGFRQAGKIQQLARIAARVDAITAATRSMLVARGLEDQSTISAWEQAYRHYVPLFRDSEEPHTGQGFKVLGPESKRAMGSQREAIAILAAVIAQHERAIIRAEKADVGRSLIRLAEQFPNPDFWRVDSPPTKRSINPTTGLVQVTVDPQYKSREDVFIVKERVGGRVVERVLAFNPSSERAMKLVAAMKNLDVVQLGALTQLVGRVSRLIANMATSWNPLFWATNFTRDVQTAGVNLQSTPLQGRAPTVLANIPKAIAGIADAEFRNGNSRWAQVYREFEEQGGKTGWMQLFDDLIDRQAQLAGEIRASQRSALNPLKWGGHLIEVVDKVNSAIENATRLSAYYEARAAGLSPARAASLAKNLTVNFNRKGNRSSATNAWYMFFNANVQGTARLIQALATSRRAQAMVGAMVAFAAALELLNRLIGDRDRDEDGNNPYEMIEEHIKQKNMVFMVPGSKGNHVTIPLPYGFNVFHNAGRMMMETVLGAASDLVDEKRAPLDLAWGFAQVMIDSFMPLGQSTTPGQLISPTVLDPFVQHSENKTWFGAPMRPEPLPFGPKRPDHQLYFRTTSDTAKDLAKWLSDVTGGDEIRGGSIDISPTTITHVFGTVTGGTGRFALGMFDFTKHVIGRVIGEAEPEDLPWRNVPFVGKFYGEVGDRERASKFYRLREEALRATNQAKAYRKLGEDDKAEALEAEKPELVEMGREIASRSFQKDMKGVREDFKALDQLPREERARERRRLQEEETTVMSRALRAYNDELRARRDQ
jgi:hypothetical protein